MRTRTDALRLLARSWGVASSYRDGRGRRRRVTSNTLVAILRALGVPLQGPDAAADAIRARHVRRWNGHAEPVLVAWEGRVPAISLRVPARFETTRLQGFLELETGKRRRLSWNLDDLRTSGRTRAAGQTFVQKDLPLPSPLPFGYHRVALATEEGPRRVFVISAPGTSFRPPAAERLWGFFVPLYALHSGNSWGAGDLGDLRRLVEWCAHRGGRIVATLPLLAAFLDEPFEPSPYRPASRLFWNEFYVDVPHAVKLLGGERIQERLKELGLVDSVDAFRRANLVDYSVVIRLKRRVLEELSREVLKDSGPSRRAFDAFLETHPEAAAYARFRAEREGRGDGRGGEYHGFVQWVFEGQMEETSAVARSRGVRLFLDLPLGVHPEGFDVSRYPEAFVQGMTVGAPPDVLFTSGQEWGFPPLHPERTRLDGHAYFRAVLGHHMRFASVLRIDHVMGLHRLFWIPQGWPADRGTYVRYPADELYAILCLESRRHETILVGENLGTVPAEVNRSLHRHGISPIYVLHYDLESGGVPSASRIQPEAVTSLNSHDLPPFAGFWAALDVDEREASGLLTAEQARKARRDRDRIRKSLLTQTRAGGKAPGPIEEAAVLRMLLGLLARSDAWAVLTNLEDLWSETQSQNVPGTSTGVPNWQRKIRRSFEQFTSDRDVRELLAFLDTSRRQGGSPQDGNLVRANQETS